MNDDLISRAAAIRWVKTECNPYGNPTLDFESGKKVIKHLEQMPSAQPERKTGRWIPHEDEDGEHYGDKCSECGEWYVMPYGKTNFCPNCGANMRGEQDE